MPRSGRLSCASRDEGTPSSSCGGMESANSIVGEGGASSSTGGGRSGTSRSLRRRRRKVRMRDDDDYDDDEYYHSSHRVASSHSSSSFSLSLSLPAGDGSSLCDDAACHIPRGSGARGPRWPFSWGRASRGGGGGRRDGRGTCDATFFSLRRLGWDRLKVREPRRIVLIPTLNGSNMMTSRKK